MHWHLVMWIHGYVEGLVVAQFEQLREDLAVLQEVLRPSSDRDELRRAGDRLADDLGRVEDHLQRSGTASNACRMRAHDGFISTLAPAQLVRRLLEERAAPEHDDGTSAASPARDDLGDALGLAHGAILDFMEEWRPYLTLADIARALSLIDDLPVAAAVVAAVAIGHPPATAAARCPLAAARWPLPADRARSHAGNRRGRRS